MRLTRESAIGLALGVTVVMIGAVVTAATLKETRPTGQPVPVAGETQPRRASPGLVVRMRVTAYCTCQECCGKPRSHPAYGITASGHRVVDRRHFCAADDVLPFETMISIPGYNGGEPVPVWDRGGAIYGNRIDVYFPTHEAALQWGVRNVDCVIRSLGQRRPGSVAANTRGS